MEALVQGGRILGGERESLPPPPPAIMENWYEPAAVE